MRIALDDRVPWVRPRAGLVLEEVKQPRLLAGLLVLRDSVGWLAGSSPSADRPAMSLNTGSLRSASWSFWSS
jgi:hypothetical protein